MDNRAKVVESITVIRESLQADGADLEVTDVEGSSVNIRLILGEEVCQECIMPQNALAEMLLMSIQENLPSVTAVVLEDPRTV